MGCVGLIMFFFCIVLVVFCLVGFLFFSFSFRLAGGFVMVFVGSVGVRDYSRGEDALARMRDVFRVQVCIFIFISFGFGFLGSLCVD